VTALATDDVLAAVDRLTVLAHHHDARHSDRIPALGDLAVLTGALAAAMPPDCIIGPAEVRQLAGGVTHRTFKLWREGQNLAGRGPFPTPVRELEIGPVFDRRAVTAWLERHA
jgi:hypothetical protein